MSKLLARVQAEDGGIVVRSPHPGVFRPKVEGGDAVGPGTLLGHLDILGEWVPVCWDSRLVGTVAAACTQGPVEYDGLLCQVHPLDEGTHTVEDEPTEDLETLRAVRAPYPGRFYARPAPDQPPFVAVGEQIQEGQTVGLLEVMKTFNRITHAGPPARVAEILVADGDDVAMNAPLVRLDQLRQPQPASSPAAILKQNKGV